ncbi:hypothetical protein NZD89_13225 [Alicyclobacillus fastidiosus]|uniref:DUF4321 domain-containing protein n=1 Tax=Alicyclobacillus fastidiosus TaxID=392011 RepID=A0ABY6ZMZ5_9BACL|nr:hypothetical protein [Alicyclobacillus fastidiosus]WAH44254.1 hypothetical protein NZD89_13225 [Alicyclobacillus fastidiosus]GMA60576.1 hypothetical protein GCM10025859_10160 [Alicyclobacillus fastidiosus]
MRNTGWRKVGLVAAATVVGSLADILLSSRLPMLRPLTHVSWHPNFNLAVIQFSLSLTLTVNWGTLVGFACGVLVLRGSK